MREADKEVTKVERWQLYLLPKRFVQFGKNSVPELFRIWKPDETNDGKLKMAVYSNPS